MDISREGVLVAGEPLEQLREILTQVRMTNVSGKGVRVCADLTYEEGALLTRAIMRVEAELLLLDAARVTAEFAEPRTAAQRRADAFVALALRVADAVDT